jgi:hypothetical protein
MIRKYPSNQHQFDYNNNKANAKRRGIEWQLTWEEWWHLWQPYYHLRGRTNGSYQLCRNGDSGPYSINNCYIATREQNRKEQRLNLKCNYKKVTLINKITSEELEFNTVKLASEFLKIKDANFMKYMRANRTDWKLK